MPHNLLKRADELHDLRGRVREAVRAAFSKWPLAGILADGDLLQDLLPGVIEQAEPLLVEAVEKGAASGLRILDTIGAKPGKADTDFQYLAGNALADAAAATLAATERFREAIERESQRMAGQGMAPEAVLEALREDWARGSRGRISGSLWAGVERALADAAVRIYILSELAVRVGQEIEIRG